MVPALKLQLYVVFRLWGRMAELISYITAVRRLIWMKSSCNLA